VNTKGFALPLANLAVTQPC